MIEQIISAIFAFIIPPKIDKIFIPKFDNIILTEALDKSEEKVPPKISATSAMIINVETGESIYSKNSNNKVAPASLAKLLSSLVIIQNVPLDRIYRVPSHINNVGGSKNHLKPGELISVRDLLAMALIESSNQAAHTLAINFAGSEKRFSTYTNRLAYSLGMRNSRFLSSVGFDKEGQYTTAEDLKKLAMYAIRHPLLHTLSSEKSKLVNNHTIKATNKLLGQEIPGFMNIEGLKTGTTPKAGECLITAAKTNKGNRILVIVLDSKDRYKDAKNLLIFGKNIIE